MNPSTLAAPGAQLGEQGDFNPYATAQRQFDEAADRLNLDHALRHLLRVPQYESHFTLPVTMDDGSMRIFQGFRVQYNTALGPAKGGLRWHPQETIDTVRALAAWMTWKTSLLKLPLGGGKGGVVCDPRQLSIGEQERLARAFMRALSRFIGIDVDVPAPDVYTNARIMGWMLDEYEIIRGRRSPGVITGKPLALGGSLGRDDATARGAVYVVREALQDLSMNPSEQTYAVQGFGNAGQHAARLHQQILGGGKLVAISDSRAGVYSSQGIDPQAAIEHKMHTGSVAGLPGTEPLENGDLLELKVDVLYPSALENAIRADNAHKVQAKIVAECANGPTTPEADEILHDRGILVLPDFLANAGGVTVSYFEQVQNQSNHYWTLDRIHKELDQRMTEAYRAVREKSLADEVHPRLAAYMVAVLRVAEACVARGWAKRVYA